MESPDREVLLNTEVSLWRVQMERSHCILIQRFLSMESPDREVPLYLNTEVSSVQGCRKQFLIGQATN